MIIDGSGVARRRRDSRISRRALARASGQSVTTIEYVEETGDVTHLPCGVLDSIARALGTTFAELCDVPATSDPPVGLEAQVGAAVAGATNGVTVDALTTVLQVSADDIESAAARVADGLRRVGMTVSLAGGHLVLVPVTDGVVSADSISAAHRQIQLRITANTEAVRFAYRVWRGETMDEIVDSPGKRRLDIGRLVNAGLIIEPASDPTRLTDDVCYSLMLHGAGDDP